MTTLSAQLRKDLVSAEKAISKSHGQDRYTAIDRSNRLRDKLYDFAEKHSQRTFFVPSYKKRFGRPGAEVEILRFSDGLFVASVSVDLPEAGMAMGFNEEQTFSTEVAATKWGVEEIKKYVEPLKKCPPSDVQKRFVVKVLLAANEYLASHK